MTPEDVKKRYQLAAGHFLVVRDKVAETDTGEFVASTVTTDAGKKVQILGTSERVQINQLFEPWATVLMVGPKYHDDDYCPPVHEGQRVFISATGGRDVTLGEGDDAMEVTLIPHSAVLFWDTETPS